MLVFMKKLGSVLMGILFFASLSLNALFLLGQGIQVVNNYHQEQNQQQAQLILTPFARQGTVKWLSAKPSDTRAFLEGLAPEESLFAKVMGSTVLYPRLEHSPTPLLLEKKAEPTPAPKEESDQENRQASEKSSLGPRG